MNSRPLTASVDAILDAIPYCRFLGITARMDAPGEVLCVLAFAPHIIGNPVLPAIHGGVLGAFLETAAIMQVIAETGGAALPKPVDVTIDYLRSARPVDCFAKARITKLGRRVVNVHAECWQEDAAKPVAALRGHFLIAA